MHSCRPGPTTRRRNDATTRRREDDDAKTTTCLRDSHVVAHVREHRRLHEVAARETLGALRPARDQLRALLDSCNEYGPSTTPIPMVVVVETMRHTARPDTAGRTQRSAADSEKRSKFSSSERQGRRHRAAQHSAAGGTAPHSTAQPFQRNARNFRSAEWQRQLFCILLKNNTRATQHKHNTTQRNSTTQAQAQARAQHNTTSYPCGCSP